MQDLYGLFIRNEVPTLVSQGGAELQLTTQHLVDNWEHEYVLVPRMRVCMKAICQTWEHATAARLREKNFYVSSERLRKDGTSSFSIPTSAVGCVVERENIRCLRVGLVDRREYAHAQRCVKWLRFRCRVIAMSESISPSWATRCNPPSCRFRLDAVWIDEAKALPHW